MVALINQWRHTAAELENRLGRTLDVEEMADIMHLPLRKAKIIHRIVEVISSVRETSGGDGSDENQMLEATLEDQSAAKPEDALVADEEKAKVLRLHYGLDGCKPMTLKQIGKELGLTRERIRQIQRDALTKLYEYMNEQ